MKILFMVHRQTIEGEPMGCMQLSAIAKARGHLTELCGLNENFLKIIEKKRPDLLAISMMTTEYEQFRRAIRAIRRSFPTLPIVIGGPHPTFAPDSLDQLEGADAAGIGECDGAFSDLLERSESGLGWQDIPNIRLPGQRGTPAKRPLLENLDTLPFVDRELVYHASYAARSFRLRSFYTSRGCPFKCTYCFNHAYNEMYKGLGSIVRRRSVENVIEEMARVKRDYPTEFIRISDDSFVLKADPWLEDFARQYRARIGLPFYCLVRAEVMKPEVVRLLKEAGCFSVLMAIESGNARLRKEVMRRGGTNEQIIRAFDLCHEVGIHATSNNIIALPSSTFTDEMDTLDLNIRCRPAYAGFGIAVPFPGTELFGYCQQHGFLPPDLPPQELNRTTLQPSVLSGFTEAEKKAQLNLAFLAPMVIRWPRLKSLVVQRLIHWPTPGLFALLLYLFRNYQYKKYVVSISFTLKDYAVLGFAQLKHALYSSMSRVTHKTGPEGEPP